MVDDPSLWHDIPEHIKNLLPYGGAGGVALIARHFLTHKPGDQNPCTTRYKREKIGMIWNAQIAVHPRTDGKLEITPLSPDSDRTSDQEDI